ncbi:hypothetical protein SUGI_0595110 [Cryptomeria japonica]|nr:hypothetical protein SUGI_0595110 [Cryptomeria japonica]
MASRCSRLYLGRLLHYEKCTAKTRLFSTGRERKRRVMSKEDRAEAVNSFVKQYMLQFPGKFPTFTLVMKEVGGSADVLRKLLAELKISLKTSQDQKQKADVDEGAHEAAKSVAPKNSSTDAELNAATSMEINSLKQKVLLSSDNISGIDTAVSQQETLSQSIKNESVAQSFSDQSSPPLSLEKLCTDVNDGAQEAARSEAPENLSTDTKSNGATDLKIDSLKQKASLSFDNISGNDVPKKQNKTLSQLIKKRMESLSDVNDGAQEAAKSIAPENLSTDSKSNDATVLEIDSLKQKAPWSVSNIFGNDIPENKKRTLSQSTREEKSISESFSDKRLLPEFLKKLFGEKVENNEYEKNCSTAPASPKESLGTILLGNQEKTSLQSSNNKWEPKIALEKIKNNQHNEGYSSVHSKGSSSTNTKIKNLELDKMRGGIPVAASIHLDEVAVKNNSNKEVNCSNFILKHLEQDKLGELNVVESTNLDDRNFENNANKEVNDNTSAITSNGRNLCASNTPKKIVSEQSIEVGYAQHSPGVTLSPKVDNKQKGRGSDVSKVMSSLGTDTNTQTRIWHQTKQLGQNQSGRNFPSAFALLDHKDSDDEWEDDSDFAAFDYPEPDRGVTPQKKFSEPKNRKCLLVMFLPCSATAEDLVKAFGHCGQIDEVKIIQSKREESRYNYASIIFRTEETFQKALTKKNLLVCGSELLVKMAFSSNQNLCQDSAPRVAENVAVPLAELKNPRCTIMIKGLPHAISFKHLKNALAFFGNVSRFLMGPSNSTIYVEFETDDAKERALMAHWICIGGQQLQIRTVETPRTSVVRISNLSSETWNSKILNVCSSFGCVKRLHRRAQDIVDVHFHQSELVNMLDILDSLNGVFMNECRWHAQLATVFSREALQSLWSSDDGREYLQSVIQNLFKVINKNCFNENDLHELAAQYYREEFSGTKQPLIPTARTMC